MDSIGQPFGNGRLQVIEIGSGVHIRTVGIGKFCEFDIQRSTEYPLEMRPIWRSTLLECGENARAVIVENHDH